MRFLRFIPFGHTGRGTSLHELGHMGTFIGWHVAQGNWRCSECILTLWPPIKTPSEVSVAHPHSTRTPSQHHWGHVSSMFCLHWGLEPRTFHFSAQSPTDWATADVLNVRAKWWAEAPVPVQPLSQSTTYSPQSPSPAPLPLYFPPYFSSPSSLFFRPHAETQTHPSPFGLQMRLLVTPLQKGGRKSSMQTQNYDLHNKKWGVGQNEWVTEREHEKIHTNPNLCRASASASEINLQSDKPTSQST